MPVEHERRFLLHSVPSYEPDYTRVLRQVYWHLGDGWVLRLRRQGKAFEIDDWIGLKGPRRGEDRLEFEYQLGSSNDQSSSEHLLQAMQAANGLYKAGSAHQVVKTRRGMRIDGDTWDIDEFHLANEGLVIAELEMKDLTSLRMAECPTWAIREITTEPRYFNENLALNPYSKWPDEWKNVE